MMRKGGKGAVHSGGSVDVAVAAAGCAGCCEAAAQIRQTEISRTTSAILRNICTHSFEILSGRDSIEVVGTAVCRFLRQGPTESDQRDRRVDAITVNAHPRMASGSARAIHESQTVITE